MFDLDNYERYENCRNEMYKKYNELLKQGQNDDLDYDLSKEILDRADGILQAIHILDKHYS